MEIAGLGIGIVSLAGLFSTCLDVIDRIDSYRDYATDSSAILAKLDADKLLFQQWGVAVGMDNGVLKDQHHRNLDDPVTLAAVQKILLSIRGIADESDEGPNDKSADSRRSGVNRFRGGISRRTKVEWSLRGKAKFLTLSQCLGDLVQRLRALVPPDSSSTTEVAMAPQTGKVSKSASDVDEITRRLDLQRIFIGIEKQLERKA